MTLKYLPARWVTTARQSPIDPTNLAEIRVILEGIKSGALKHHQGYFHSYEDCGTAHCIAGWKAHRDAVKAGYTPEYELNYSTLEQTAEMDFDPEMSSNTLDTFLSNDGEWYYAQHQWGLTPAEAEALFDSAATLDQLFELVELLEAGLTITLKSRN